MKIEALIEAGAWPEDAHKWAHTVAEIVSDRFSLDGFEATVLFTDDAQIRELNSEYRNKDKATDVLSWPSLEFAHEMGEEPSAPQASDGPFATTLGDIALGFETCQKDAGHKKFAHHIQHLVLHGFLHLLGYDHIDDRDAVIMERLEVEILKKMHIDSPYEDKQV